jgi:SAM-dependent methyltransferase
MSSDKYLDMQRTQYQADASQWSLENKNPVVGWYDQHEASPLYDEVLFREIDTRGMVALDYGCGPGRCLVRFHDRFDVIDGVDISETNLENARLNLEDAGVAYAGRLLLTPGDSLSDVVDDTYDLVYSVICFQHIAVHEIRFRIWSEIFRVLKPGGWFCFQMGYGSRPDSVGYYDNEYDAPGTNGWCDVRVEDIRHVEEDLGRIGFQYRGSRMTEPIQDLHEMWTWVQARKPNPVDTSFAGSRRLLAALGVRATAGVDGDGGTSSSSPR